MGSFLGHIVPGTFFLLFSIWWTFSIFRRYFEAHFKNKFCKSVNREKKGKKKIFEYRNVSSFLLLRRRKNNNIDNNQIINDDDEDSGWPIESWLKLIAVVIGMLGELVTGFEPSGTFVMHNGQHMTMFAFFALNAVFELMYHFRVPAMPPQLEYAAAIIAYAVEGLLFLWHLEGRPPMDVQVHTFLIYAIGMCVVATIAEMACIHDVRPALARSAFTFLQGTWFYQVAFVLYPPWGLSKWDEFDHRQMMLVTMIFAWHLGVTVLFQILVACIVYRRVRSRFTKNGMILIQDLEQSSSEEKNLLNKNENKFSLHEISEEDEPI